MKARNLGTRTLERLIWSLPLPQIPRDEIRQIKWILAGILACLVVITLKLVPGLISLVIIVAIAYALMMLPLTVSQTARRFIGGIWFQLSRLWRR